MPDLRNKTILILSPQAWGKMFISKHHYSLELAKRGNTVYFLNPPDQRMKNKVGSIEIKPSDVQSRLYHIEHRLFFPYILKFKTLFFFHWLMGFQVKRILTRIGQPIDIVWSFDIGNLYPLDLFSPKSYKIFHPVDEPQSPHSIKAAQGANVILSVTPEILEKYHLFNVPKFSINHGVTEDFLELQQVDYNPNLPLRIGISGNLLRVDIDRETLLHIIDENGDCKFEFWGSYEASQSNVSISDEHETIQFIGQLRNRRNCILHGAVSYVQLAKAIQQMDAFLICYDVKKDHSKGTNYHKVMEYLATGKLIVSNNISTYRDRPDLVQMVLERENNRKLPTLFKQVINAIQKYNSSDRIAKRKSFALENTYERQVDRIEKLIDM